MSERRFQILCTGDVHLGRRPSRVPAEGENLSVDHVWSSFVDAALSRDVDAAVLTGDVVDAENKMYEAFGALERGIRRLLGSGVHVVAVAGNHDYDAFPRLVRSIDEERFHLLGSQGQWESVSIPSEEGPKARFAGWSFPEAIVPGSPLGDLELEEGSGPTIGVLHCEAGRTESRYAPVGRDALARQPVDAWLLGHIHEPENRREGGQLQLYPGSLQPLDPGEPGEHGAWLIEVGLSGDVDVQMTRLASLRYDELAVDVGGIGEPEEVETTVLETLRNRLTDLVEQEPRLRHVAYRLVYEGRTQLHGELEAQARAMIEDLEVRVDEARATVEGFETETRPDYDLGALAEGDDPAGVLAQLLLDLRAGDENTEDEDTEDEDTEPGEDSESLRALLRAVDKATGSVHESSGYEPLRRDSETQGGPSRKKLRSLLERQGYQLLDKLQGHRE